jgi:hypothetical protein
MGLSRANLPVARATRVVRTGPNSATADLRQDKKSNDYAGKDQGHKIGMEVGNAEENIPHIVPAAAE